MKISKGLIATIIIISISGVAFAAGFLKERVVTEMEDVNSLIAADEILVDRMDARISDTLNFDHLRGLESTEKLEIAKDLFREYQLTLANLTQAEEFIILNLSLNAVHDSQGLTRSTNMGKIVKHFSIDNGIDDFYLANEKDDGFNLSISRDYFLAYNESLPNSLAKIKTPISILGNGLDTFYDTFYTNPYTQFIRLESFYSWISFFRNKTAEVNQRIIQNKEILSDLESKISYYTYGLTIITIATILASAMATQLGDQDRERDFSHIKAKIYQNDDLIIKKVNRIAIPVLIIALVIAILGLLVPFLIGLIS